MGIRLLNRMMKVMKFMPKLKTLRSVETGKVDLVIRQKQTHLYTRTGTPHPPENM